MESSIRAENRIRTRKVGPLVVLIAILVMGAIFRFYNINWDKGTYHIHPDERHTAMVITAIRWPSSLGEYFDTSNSGLNPRNVDKVYFYGTLPLFLTKYVATQLDALRTAYAQARPDPMAWAAAHPSLTGYDQIHLVGRVLSGLFDLGSVLILFFLARRLFDWRVGLITSFLLALTALNIQGSHYFSVDTFLTFFVTLTTWFTLDVAEGKGWPAFLALGVSMGLTLACKVSVFLLALVVALGVWIWVRRQVLGGTSASRALLRAAGGLALAAIVAIGIFRVAQPYAWAGPNYDRWETVPQPWGERFRVFEKIPEPIRAVVMPNPQWVTDIVSAGAQQTGEADLPWGRQWTERMPWLYPLENMILWGMGVPLGIGAWLGVALVSIEIIRACHRRRTQGLEAGELRSREQNMDSGHRASECVRAPMGQWVSGRWDLVLIPLAWVLLTFLWQGMQFVKSIRYFLPIYPFLAMFAAYLVVRAWDWAKGRKWTAKAGAAALAAFVLLGTLGWASAFIQIYREPVTRVQATRWMYETIETGATLHYSTTDGESGQLQIPLPSTHIYTSEDPWLVTPFVPPRDLIATQVTMNDLTSVEGVSDGIFEIQITSDRPEEGLLAGAKIEAIFGDSSSTSEWVRGMQSRHTLDLPDAPLAGDQRYYLQTRLLQGTPLISEGAAIANEHFDDPLPFSMDGHIAFGSGPYRGLDLALYNEDTPEKLEEVLNILDEADYISMSSGRLYTSIPRLPMRYPMTTRYYELLFGEELGFEKAAEFHAYPRLFGIEFNDDRAEEQFTVYDHPKVLIYRKTDDYDRERVRAMLSEGIDWSSIPHWLNPRDVAEWKRSHQQQNDLMLTETQRMVQEQGGTWASLFDRGRIPIRGSLANQWPTLTWLVLIAILGLAALPLTVAILGPLPDRGYILARPVGVLLLAWLSWMLTNLTPLGYTPGTILLALALIAIISLGSLVFPSQRRRLVELWRTRKRLMIVNEALFLVFFALFWLIRWGNPDLWHAWKGGEKPMDFAYLNAVIKSTEFPPYDPWFAGGYLNYYYFGQVMVGTLVKLIGIMPAVAYNLVIPTWFSMTAMGAFSVTYNLVAQEPQRPRGVTAPDAVPVAAASSLRPIFFGLVGALFVAILGNLGEIHLLLIKLGQGVAESFQSTIPGLAALVRTLIGSAEVVFGGRALPISLDEWYWNASRAIPAGPYEAVITEFPFFTFLYADLHAHLIAMPLTFVSLALALVVVQGAASASMKAEADAFRCAGSRASECVRSRLVRTLAPLLLWSLTIGAMRTTNTWDVPPHLLVVLGACTIAAFSRPDMPGQRTPIWQRVASVAWQFGLVFVLSWSVLYRPFWASYGSFYNSIALWNGTRTRLWAFVVVHGLFLFAIISYLCALVIGERRHDPLLRRLDLTVRYRDRRLRLGEIARSLGVRGLPLSRLLWIGLVLLILLELFFLVPGLIPFTQPSSHGDAAHRNASAAAVEAGGYTYRGLAIFALGLPVALMGLLVLFRPGLSPTKRLWAYLVLLGLGMALGVDVIVLQGDIGRMNTVFKFYLQVWLMWGVAAAAALAWMVPRLWRWQQSQRLWLFALALLLVFAGLYPPLAARARIQDRFDPSLGPGLDGWAYMKTAQYFDPNGQQYALKWDLEAMQWMLDNVVGSPTILEGQTPEYRWGSRYSINTGLPTVLGWNWHQRQQRAAANDQEVWARVDDVATIYDTPFIETAESLLRQYNVRYVIVGPLERTYYTPTGLAKFERMDSLRPVYRNDEVTIYEVTW